MDFIVHGYCGLYCGACPIMLNTKQGWEPNDVMVVKVNNLQDIAQSVASRPAHAAAVYGAPRRHAILRFVPMGQRHVETVIY